MPETHEHFVRETIGLPPELEAELLRDLDPREARRRKAIARQILAICPIRLRGVADACIERGLGLEEAREQILEAMEEEKRDQVRRALTGQ